MASPSHGEVSRSNSGKYPSVATYNCDAGYRFSFFSATVRWTTRQYLANTHALPGVLNTPCVLHVPAIRSVRSVPAEPDRWCATPPGRTRLVSSLAPSHLLQARTLASIPTQRGARAAAALCYICSSPTARSRSSSACASSQSRFSRRRTTRVLEAHPDAVEALSLHHA